MGYNVYSDTQIVKPRARRSSLQRIWGWANRLTWAKRHTLAMRKFFTETKTTIWVYLSPDGTILKWRLTEPAPKWIRLVGEDGSSWVMRRFTPSHVGHIVKNYPMDRGHVIKDIGINFNHVGAWDPVAEWGSNIAKNMNDD